MPKAIFVTGGARGIGAAIVRECLALGHDVAFTHRDDADEVREAAALVAAGANELGGPRCRAYALDVRDSKAVDAVADKVIDDFEEIYGAVCNAGINVIALTSQLSDDDWDDVLRVNLTGAFYTARAFLDHMVTNRAGRIVMISSLNRYGASGTSAYSASKAGLVGLARTIAKEYGSRGITCNCVAPGLVESGMTHGSMTGEMEGFWKKHCSVGRLGVPSEVAFAVGFLLSERASLVNGETLAVTGGLDWFP